MYYKIVNKDCEVYQKLHALRTEELRIEEQNKQAIDERIGIAWKSYFGRHGQQNFCRVTEYSGFQFTEPEKIDPKLWVKHPEHPEIYIPNRRTKQGREIAKFLSNGLKGGWYGKVLDILDLPNLARFSFPVVDIVDDTIVVFLGDGHQPKDENLIEITSKEFNEIRSKLFEPATNNQ
jgi:hypothetical protein